MTVARRKLTTLDKLKIVVAQARCPLCGERLGDLADLDFDHAHALALGGADEIENLRAVHRDCHAVKTRGAGATTAGSDIGKMKKLRHLIAKQAEFNARILAKGGNPLLPDDKPNRTKRKRAWGYRPLRGGSSFKNRSKP